MPSFRPHLGTMAIVALLLTAILLMSILTAEAVDAERAHRAAAQQAVRDVASIVADDLLRRTVFELEMFVSVPMRRVVLNHLKTRGKLPPMETLRQNDQLREALPLVDRLFLVDLRAGRVDPPQPEPLQTWLLTRFPATVSQHRDFPPTLRVHLGDGDHLLIYGTALIDQGRMFAFTLRDGAIGRLAAHAFSRRSAFPGILDRGHLTNGDVFIRFSRENKDHVAQTLLSVQPNPESEGRELFRTAGSFDPSSGVSMTAPANYSEAVGGLRIESSIAPRAVSALVAGGVPPSRLPRLLAMLLASAGVLVAALMIVRRERQLADLRSDFVSGVSHELRTPLSEIRMFSETLLLDRIRTPAERQRSLQIINEEARRLENLVNNVLFFTRSNGAHRPLTGDCDMETLVSGTIDAFAPLATRRGVVVTAEVPSGLRAPVDEEAWRQVLTNILDNAVKYGPPGQTVRVRVTAPDPRLRMEVEDEGPGIPPSEREAVWRRFHRLERDRLTHNAGCGIGLAIVRTIVDRHGGRCWIEEANGGGARFVVEVPLSAEARATTAPARQAETTT